MKEVEPVRQWLAEASRVIESVDAGAVATVVRALGAVRDAGGAIFVAGNGGSASTASHFALDLQKTAGARGEFVRAICLADNPGLITAWANDQSFAHVFAAPLETLAQPGDALVVISVSGSSPNVIAALHSARRMGLLTVGLLGRDGGAARALVDHPVVVASDDYGWVESAHVVLEHVISYALREAPPRSLDERTDPHVRLSAPERK